VNLAALIGTFYFTSTLFVLVVLGSIARLAASRSSAHRLHQGRAADRARYLVIGNRAAADHAEDGAPRRLALGGRPRGTDRLQLQPRRHQHLHGRWRRCFWRRPPTPSDDLAGARHLGVAIITSKGRFGCHRAGFITLAATLSIVPDIPIQSIAILVGIDKFMSECAR